MASKTAKFKKKINGVIYDIDIVSDAKNIKVDDKGGTVASMLEGFNTKLQELDTTIQEADPAGLRTDITTIQEEMTTYGTKVSTLETTVAGQVEEIANKADSTKVTEALEDKADRNDVYTKTEVDTALDAKADNTAVSDLNTALTTLTTTVEGHTTEIADKATISAVAALETTVNNKTDGTVDGTNGKALIFNEGTGGGAKFEHNDGTWSFAGVNDGDGGINAQIYAVKKNASNKFEGAKLDVTVGAMYYTVGDASPSERDIPANEIAVKGDLEDKADRNDVYTKSEVDAAIAAAVPTTQAIEAIIENYLNTHQG